MIVFLALEMTKWIPPVPCISLAAFHTLSFLMFLSDLFFFHLPCFSNPLDWHDAFPHSSLKTHTHLHAVVFPLIAHLHFCSVTCLEACWLPFIISSSLSGSSFFLFFSLPSTHFLPLTLFCSLSFLLIFLYFFWYFINMIIPPAWDVKLMLIKDLTEKKEAVLKFCVPECIDNYLAFYFNVILIYTLYI